MSGFFRWPGYFQEGDGIQPGRLLSGNGSLGSSTDFDYVYITVDSQELIKCSIIRGGTSKAVFFLRNDLPRDEKPRDGVILRVLGSPDPRQIDGLGGADLLTSKVAIIGPPTRKDCDVDYLFGQVSLREPLIDYAANCGNLAAAVGPFAIDEGLIDPVEPVTIVRIHQVNTGIRMTAEVPVRGNRAEIEGDYAIPGVPGTGAKINVDFSESGGMTTGNLITGNATQVMRVEGMGDIELSLVDAGTVSVFIRARDLGLKGTESPQEIESDAKLIDRIEKIRSHGAERLGLVDDWRKASSFSPLQPIVVICAPPTTYRDWITGKGINEESIDLVCRSIGMGIVHKAFSATGSICTLAAAMIPGTIPNQLTRPEITDLDQIRIGHPAGIIVAEGIVAEENGRYVLKKATIGRTARCLMKGYALVPKKALSS